MIDFIQTEDAPEPNGHYSQATVIRDIIFVAAQLPSKEHSSIDISSTDKIEWEVHSVLESILSIVKEAGGNLGSIGSVRFYTTSVDYWPIINDVFENFMGSHKPARAVVNVTSIKMGFSIMAEAVAEKLD